MKKLRWSTRVRGVFYEEFFSVETLVWKIVSVTSEDTVRPIGGDVVKTSVVKMVTAK